VPICSRRDSPVYAGIAEGDAPRVPIHNLWPVFSALTIGSEHQIMTTSDKTDPNVEAPKLLDQLRDAIRVRHYSIRTENALTLLGLLLIITSTEYRIEKTLQIQRKSTHDKEPIEQAHKANSIGQ
jgi:hypothetical protein